MASGRERVVGNLNRALHEMLASEDSAYMLGEDIVDPYGGAFKVSRGLSERFPERVIATPISEAAIVGMASGLALSGAIAIVEIMFGDFLFLAFDQLVNFAAKAVSMYGRRLPMRMIVRSAVGGGRGYGATHSQSPQKHFIGVPDLTLVEMSPFHDNKLAFDYMISLGNPCLFFENKKLYSEYMYLDDCYGEIFAIERPSGYAPVRLFVDDGEADIDCLFIVAGGAALPTLKVARDLVIEVEANCQVLVLGQIYPFDLGEDMKVLRRARRICVVEESVAGGTWGESLAQHIYTALWPDLRGPVLLAHSKAAVIPAAPHLEKDVLISEESIRAVAWPEA